MCFIIHSGCRMYQKCVIYYHTSAFGSITAFLLVIYHLYAEKVLKYAQNSMVVVKMAEKCVHKLSFGGKVLERAIQSTKRVVKGVLFHLWLIIPSAVGLAVNHGVFGVAAGPETCLFLRLGRLSLSCYLSRDIML